MCIYFVTGLTTGTQWLPKRLFRTVRSGVSYFNLQYPLLSFRSNGSCLHFVPRPSVTPSFLQYRVSKAVPMQDVINPVSLPFLYFWRLFLSSLSLSNTSTFLTWSVQLIFSSTTFENFPCIFNLLSEVSESQRHTELSSKYSTLLISSSNQVQFSEEKSLLHVECCFSLGNHRFKKWKKYTE